MKPRMAKVVQLAVQLSDSEGRRESHRLPSSQDVSSTRDACSGDPRRVPCSLPDGVSEMSVTDIRAIAERIEQRLAAMAEHEAAIRADLDTLASLTLADDGDHLLDISAAASWLGVSRATMFRLIRNDPALRRVKLGKRTLFRPEDLKDYASGLVAS